MGPGCTILLNAKLTEIQINEVENIKRSISSHQNGDDFWVISTLPVNGSSQSTPRPFLLCKENFSDDMGYEETELESISASIGYKPVSNIQIAAMSNQDIDHKILGELALYLAKKFQGHIDLGENILPVKYLPIPLRDKYLSNSSHCWSKYEPHFQKFKRDASGNIASIQYSMNEGRTWVSHICDASFLEYWLKSPEFHMIK